MAEVYTVGMESQERHVNFSEQDVRRVAAELPVRPEGEPGGAASREQVRQALVAALPKPAPAPALSAQPIQGAPAEERVHELVALAVTSGIDAAHAAASREEPFVLDALHDALAGALHAQLEREGKL